jgi:hypothetical protein
VNLLKSYIPVEQAQELVKIKESKPILKSLCGLTMDETELDFSSQSLRAGDAVLLASDIQDMGSLSKLTFYGGIETWCWEEGKVVTIDTTMTEADFSRKKLGVAGAQILVAFMSTKLFEASGSLASLDISNNSIGSKQKAIIKQICTEKPIALTCEDDENEEDFECENDCGFSGTFAEVEAHEEECDDGPAGFSQFSPETQRVVGFSQSRE